MSFDYQIEEPPQVSIAPSDVEQRRQYRNERKAFILRQLYNVMEYIAASLLCFCIGYIVAALTNVGHCCMACLLIWIIFYIYRIIRLSRNLRQKVERERFRHIIFMLVKNCLNIISFTAILIEFNVNARWVISIALLFINIAAITPIIGYTKPKNNCFSFMRWMKILLALNRSITITLVLLSYRKIYKITYTTACL